MTTLCATSDGEEARISELIDGTPLRPASLHRLLCGAHVHRLVISADGEVLDAAKDIHVLRPRPPP
ncbi:hypothetical protein HC251_15435 [Iamia sp. SCSIO 61187]|uniref:hypothetical protein n=1 Tax=Iamia sp. SCSIO 61187 TaxID=2722752 RepID=UPI001C639083|nr:hypothetical protein [Iamia sp. SCSIO 61187]QYG93677.1 hypothetical protein HC251_15435 [Iamia sp. SCSIO 61187]